MANIDDVQTQKANSDYIRISMNEPILERDHELDLATRWRDQHDEKALHELVTSYRRLVVSIAKKFKNYGLPTGDLIQEGNIGLMYAANRFEPERELRFSTYATWWIRSSIQDYVLRNWSIVRTGTTAAQKSLFFNLRRLKSKIEGSVEVDKMDHDSRHKIAEELGVKVSEVESMEARLYGGDSSLNNMIGDDGEQDWQSMLADDRDNPEEVITNIKTAEARSAWLNSALSQLNAREKEIVTKRHLSYDAVTLEFLGEELGISKERVRQIEKKAMSKLKDSILSSGFQLSDVA